MINLDAKRAEHQAKLLADMFNKGSVSVDALIEKYHLCESILQEGDSVGRLNTYSQLFSNCAYVVHTPKGLKIGQTTEGLAKRLKGICGGKSDCSKKRQYSKTVPFMMIPCLNEAHSLAMESILRAALIEFYPNNFEKNDWFSKTWMFDEDTFLKLTSSPLFRIGIEQFCILDEPIFI